MSAFDRLDRALSRTIDATNAIPSQLVPMRGPANGRPGPDPDRAPVAARGIFDQVEADVGVEFGPRSVSGRRNHMRSIVSGSEPQLSVDRDLLPELPRQGDRIEFPTRADLSTFEVVRVDPDGKSRVNLRLTAPG